ncbi:MAG: MATE family efflux transporter, partial [Eubacterium sp.]|nr:MATE family efflux transporter [Eubacterium sp.]
IGMELLRYLYPFWPTFVFVEILSSSIRACGDSLVPMIMTGLGVGAMRILWILFYPSQSIFDTLRCYPISWILTSVLFLAYYLEGGWLRRSLKQRSMMMQAV